MLHPASHRLAGCNILKRPATLLCLFVSFCVCKEDCTFWCLPLVQNPLWTVFFPLTVFRRVGSQDKKAQQEGPYADQKSVPPSVSMTSSSVDFFGFLHILIMPPDDKNRRGSLTSQDSCRSNSSQSQRPSLRNGRSLHIIKKKSLSPELTTMVQETSFAATTSNSWIHQIN